MVTGKHILLGVTGGIAAYKCAYLARELVKNGAQVQVVMTPAATEFITPLTLSVLSRRNVIVEMFPRPAASTTEEWTRHIELALWADVMLVAPASANTIAKIAHGVADNFLTTLVLALRGPLVLAPAMDVDMLAAEATAANLRVLRERGCTIINPEQGDLASGLSGPGRLPEIGILIDELDRVLANAHRDLQGRTVLITAGPTEEPLDPVRYVGNRSSGKMGYALATAASLRGAEVTLVSGPVSRETPRHVRRIDVRTAREMHNVVLREFASTDMLIMAAAVADFSPVAPSPRKIKRDRIGSGRLTIELSPNPDILKEVGVRKTGQVLVGFALETDDGESSARKKLQEKNCDLMVLNNPLDEGAAFGADTNVVSLYFSDGRTETLPKMAKIDVAHEILNRVGPLLVRTNRA